MNGKDAAFATLIALGIFLTLMLALLSDKMIAEKKSHELTQKACESFKIRAEKAEALVVAASAKIKSLEEAEALKMVDSIAIDIENANKSRDAQVDALVEKISQDPAFIRIVGELKQRKTAPKNADYFIP